VYGVDEAGMLAVGNDVLNAPFAPMAAV